MITGECTEERDILECSCVELKARWSRAPQRTCHCPLRIGHPPVRQGLRTGGHIPLCHCRPHREPRYCTASDRGRPKPLCRLCPPSVIPPRFPISPLLEHLDLQSCGYPISEGRPLARPPPIPQRSGRGRAARIVYVQPGYFKSGEFALPTHGQLFRAPSFRKRGHLHHPVPDRRNPRRPQLAIRLRDAPPRAAFLLVNPLEGDAARCPGVVTHARVHKTGISAPVWPFRWIPSFEADSSKQSYRPWPGFCHSWKAFSGIAFPLRRSSVVVRFRQAVLPSSDSAFLLQGPFAPRALPRFPATTNPSATHPGRSRLSVPASRWFITTRQGFPGSSTSLSPRAVSNHPGDSVSACSLLPCPLQASP